VSTSTTSAPREPVVHHRGGVGAVLPRAYDLHARARRPRFELFGGGGAERVRGHEQRALAVARVMRRELAGERGLAHAVDADEQRHPRLLGPGSERRPRSGKELRRRALERAPQVECRVLLEECLRLVDQLVGRRRTDVRREQRRLQRLGGGGIHLAPAERRADGADERLTRAREPAAELLPQTQGRPYPVVTASAGSRRDEWLTSTPSRFTETSFETPSSCIVTP
jgi:hypothetical protein